MRANAHVLASLARARSPETAWHAHDVGIPSAGPTLDKPINLCASPLASCCSAPLCQLRTLAALVELELCCNATWGSKPSESNLAAGATHRRTHRLGPHIPHPSPCERVCFWHTMAHRPRSILPSCSPLATLTRAVHSVTAVFEHASVSGSTASAVSCVSALSCTLSVPPPENSLAPTSLPAQTSCLVWWAQ